MRSEEKICLLGVFGWHTPAAGPRALSLLQEMNGIKTFGVSALSVVLFSGGCLFIFAFTH